MGIFNSLRQYNEGLREEEKRRKEEAAREKYRTHAMGAGLEGNSPFYTVDKYNQFKVDAKVNQNRQNYLNNVVYPELEARKKGEILPQHVQEAQDRLNTLNDQVKGLINSYGDKYYNMQPSVGRSPSKEYMDADRLAQQIGRMQGLQGDALKNALEDAKLVAKYKNGYAAEEFDDSERLIYAQGKLSKLSKEEQDDLMDYARHYDEALKPFTNDIVKAPESLDQTASRMNDKRDNSPFTLNKSKKAIQEKYKYSDEELQDYLNQAKIVYDDIRNKQETSAFAIDPNASSKDKFFNAVRNTTYDLGNAPIRGFSAIGSRIEQQVTDSPYNTNSVFNRIQNKSNAAKNEVTTNAIGNDHYAKQFLYNAGMSAAESFENVALGGAIGGTAGSLMPFAADAYASTYQEAKARGLTDVEADRLAVPAAAIETATEIFSVEHFWDIAKGSGKKLTKNMVIDWLAQGGIEMSEEGVGAILNGINQYLALGGTGKSEYEINVQNYINDGLSPEEAKKKANGDFWKQTGEDALAGLVSGLMMGGVGTAMNITNTRSSLKESAESYGKMAEESSGDTTESKVLKAEYEKYKQNPSRAIADRIDDSTEQGKKNKEEAMKIAEKEKSGKRLSAQDIFALSRNAEVSAEATDEKYKKYAESVAQVPEDYRMPMTGITLEEARAKMNEASKSGDVEAMSDIHAQMKNAFSEEVRNAADETFDQFVGQAENNGADIKEINAAKTSTQEAYLSALAGESRESLGALSSRSEIAYNEGTKAKLINESIGLEDSALAYSRADVRKAYLENYDPTLNVAQYNTAFNAFYNAGRARKSFESITSEGARYDWLANAIGIEKARKLYDIGLAQANSEADDKARTSVIRTINHHSKGTFIDERSNKTESLAMQGEFIANAMGINIKLIDYVPGASSRAEFSASKGEIILTERDFSSYFHENSHFGQAFASKETYDDFKALVLDYASKVKGAEGFTADFRTFERTYAEDHLTSDEITDEYVASVMVGIMTDEQNASKFFEMLNKHYTPEEATTIKEKIVDFFKSLLDNFKKFIANSHMSKTERSIFEAKTAETQKLLDAIVDKYIAMTDEAITNYKGNETSEATFNDAQHSLASIMDAFGFTLKIKNHMAIAVDSKGNEITHFTEDMVTNSQVGAILNLGVDAGNITEEDKKVQVKFFTDLMNQALTMQDVDLVWAINSLIGYRVVDDGIYTVDKKSKFAAVTGNSDPQYSSTFDPSTICVKTQAVVDVMSEVMKREGRGLTREEIIDFVYDETHKAGEPVPCPVCYVFSRWVGLGGLLDTIKNLQEHFPVEMSNDEIIKIKNRLEKDIAKMSKELGSASKSEKKIRKDFEELSLKKWMAETNKNTKFTEKDQQKYDLYQKYIDMLDQNTWFEKVRLNKDYATKGLVPNDILFDVNKGREFAENYPLTWLFRTTKGSGMGKATLPYSDMKLGQFIRGIGSPSAIGKNLGELTRNPFQYFKGERVIGGEVNKSARMLFNNALKKIKAQNLLNGQRMQSTSDFKFEYGLDYLLAFFELQAVGAKVQLYTKVPEAVPMFATVNAEVNLSLMPKGMGYEIGKDGKVYLTFSSITGMNAADAEKLTKMFNNVQPILVGINDEHIKAALAEDWITFIIPYHASGSTEDRYRAMMDIVGESVPMRSDYTDYQSDSEMSLDYVVQNITNGDKKAAQALMKKFELARSLRKAILTNEKKFDQNGHLIKGDLTVEQKKALKQFPKLQELYNRFYVKGVDDSTYGVNLTSKPAEMIMPYEYWDKSLTKAEADGNTENFKAYCDMLGMIPRFSGFKKGDTVRKGFDFTTVPGYWKMLIDRSMYNNDGTYHEQKSINISGFEMGFLDREKTVEKLELKNPSVPNDPAKVGTIADKVQERIANDTRKSLNTDYFSYEALVKKEDIPIHAYEEFGLDRIAFIYGKTKDGDIKRVARENILKYNNAINSGLGDGLLYNKDLGHPVMINSDSIKHRKGALNQTKADAKTALPLYFENAIVVNEGAGTRKGADKSYILIGVYEDNGALRIARSVVNHFDDGYQATEIEDVAYSFINTKKEEVAASAAPIAIERSLGTSSTISVSQVLELVKDFYPDILSLDVANHFGYKRKQSDIEGLKHSLDTDSEGRQLSVQQQEYFKDSKIVDENGRLKVMYHGSHSGFGFTSFDADYSDDGRSFFFTDSKEIAQQYASSDTMYKNPDSYTLEELKKVVDDFFTKIEEENGVYKINKYTYGPEFVGTDFEGDFEQLKEYVLENYFDEDAGIYPVYLNIVNPLIVNADYGYWDELPVLDENSDAEHWTTRDYSQYAEENGYDGVVFTNLYDSANALDEAQTVVVALEPNQIKLTDNLNPTEASDIRHSYEDGFGYHAGDLGKAEALSQQGYSRDTGHFGTGTYFVGNEEKINDGSYGKRPHYMVDFLKYKLFRPASERDGFKLHDFLRGVDGFYDMPKDAFKSEREWDAAREAFEEGLDPWDEEDKMPNAVAYRSAVRLFGAYDVHKALVNAEDSGVTYGYSDDDIVVYDDGYNVVKTLTEEDIAELDGFEDAMWNLLRDNRHAPRWIWRYEDWNDSLSEIGSIIHKTPSEIRAMVGEIADEISKLSYDETTTADSAATRFMKKLGYEGIDVMGYPGLDNTAYGSVIYDLKGKDLEQKIKNGARYSRDTDAEGTVLTEAQVKKFKDSKARDDQGRLVPVYHGSTAAGFTVFRPEMSDDGISLFFSDSLETAAGYSGSSELFIADAEYSFEALSDIIEGLSYGDDELIQVDENTFAISEWQTDGSTEILFEGSLNEVRDFAIDFFMGDISSAARPAVYKVYLDLKNPLILDAKDGQWNDLGFLNPNIAKTIEYAYMYSVLGTDEFEVEFSENGEYKTEVFSYATMVDFFGEEAAERLNNGLEVDNLVFDEDGNLLPHNTRTWAAYAKDYNYDGLIIKNLYDIGNYGKHDEGTSTIMIAFESNQVKSVLNLNPTDSEDIRFSKNTDEFLMSDEFTGSVNVSILEEGQKALKGKQLNNKAIKTIAEKLLQKYASSVSLSKMTNDLKRAFAYLHDQKHVSYYDAVRIFEEIARPVVEKSNNLQGREKYDAFIEAAGKNIRLTDQQMAEVKAVYGSYSEFKLQVSPITFNVNGDRTLKDAWEDIVKASDYVLNMEEDEQNMPYALADVLDSLRPSPVSDYNGDIDDTAKDLAMEIIQDYLEMQGDAKAKKAAQKFKDGLKDYRKKIRDDYRERLKRAKAEAEMNSRWHNATMDAKYKEKAAKVEADAKERIEAARARNKEANLKKAETARANAKKKSIESNVWKLTKWIDNPSEKNHVPIDMVEPILDFFTALDFVEPQITVKDGKYVAKIFSHMAVSNGRRHPVYTYVSGDTRQECLEKFYDEYNAGLGSSHFRTWVDRMRSIQDLYNKAVIANSSEDMVMSDFLAQLDGSLVDEINELVKNEAGIIYINDLNSDQLDVIDRMIKNIIQVVNRGNKAAAQNADIQIMSMDTISRGKGKDVSYSKIKQLMKLDMATPLAYFRHMGSGAEKVYEGLRKGFNTKVRDIRTASEFMEGLISAKESKKWTGKNPDYKTFNIGGRSIDLTIAQIMSLYELVKRDQTLTHMQGGFRPMVFKTGVFGQVVHNKNAEPIHLQDYEVQMITDTLTDEQKRVADAMQNFMATVCAGWGNETSRLLYGYEKFLDPNYFPISSDKNYLMSNNENTAFDSLNGIERSGFTKQLIKNASNPIMIGDIFDVFTNHVADMATYHGFAAPIKDANRWFNYKTVEDVDSVKRYDSVKNAIGNLSGAGGTEYFVKLIKDLNGMEKSQYVASFTDRLISGYKSAAVGANIRVVIQQPTAYFRAMNVIDPKYLAKAVVSPKEARRIGKMMREQSEIAWWKSQGYYETSIGKSMKEIITGQESKTEALKDWMMKPAGWADDVTWGVLYTAVAMEQQEKGLTGDELEKAIKDRFDEVVDETQVVDSTLHRSQYMRSKDMLNKLQTAFMAEPIKSYNMLLMAADTKDAKKISRAAATFLITNVITAAAAGLIDAFRRDDDDKDWGEEYVNALQENIIDNVNPLNMIPVVKDVYNAWTSDSNFGSSSNRMDLDAVNAIKDIYDAWKKVANGTSNKTAYGLYMATIRPLSQLSGIPLYNASRELTTLYNAFLPDIKKTISSNKYANVYDLISQNKSVDKIQDAVFDVIEKGGTVKDIESGITSRYKSDYYDMYQVDQKEAKKLADKAAKGFSALGYSDEDIDGIIEGWHEEAVTYPKLDKAIMSGEGIEEAVKKLQDAGKTNDKIVDHVVNKFGSTIDYVYENGLESPIETNVNAALKAIDGSTYESTLQRFEEEAKTKEQKQQETAEKKAEKDLIKQHKTELLNSVSKGGNIETLVDNVYKDGKDYSQIKKMLTDEYKGKNLSEAEKNRIAMIKAKCDEKSGFKLDSGYTSYYEYEKSVIDKW